MGAELPRPLGTGQGGLRLRPGAGHRGGAVLAHLTHDHGCPARADDPPGLHVQSPGPGPGTRALWRVLRAWSLLPGLGEWAADHLEGGPGCGPELAIPREGCGS